MLRRSIGIGLALFLNSGASAASPALSENEAADFVSRFCSTLIPAVADYDPNAAGNWPPDDPAVFGPLVTPELKTTIEKALAGNAGFEAETGGKGRLGDGVPWKAYQDAALDCRAGEISGTADHPEVEIHYRYYDDPDEGWTDTLILTQNDGEWRIDDILYGNPNFGSLKSVLATSVDEQTP
ncbi:hypothetical protein [Chelativorans alearense]|uniref:hypothetical protein n=1 Tax=Chelativorans alearense TaxID=2681495 RepID=UPI0013D00003|nr:hypothetical protein [Chelativorans alearense]